jgi:hypothetical protein
MSKLTALEKKVLNVILSSFMSDHEEIDRAIESIEVAERVFSSLHDGRCSGFYTYLQKNSILALAHEVPHDYPVQAKYSQLTAGEMGFYVFCDVSSKGVATIEGYFYGDDRCNVEELLGGAEPFSVYSTEGL